MPRMKKTSSTPAPSHRALRIVGVIYAVAAGLIVFWPSRVDAPADGLLYDFILWLRELGVPRSFANYSTIEFAANIVMFVPAGLIVALLLAPRARPLLVVLLTTVIGAGASVLIESVQNCFLPARVGDSRDIVANTSGTIIGLVCALIVLAIQRRLKLRNTARDTKVLA